MNRTTTSDQIAALIANDPTLTARQISLALNISRQAVYQHVRALGLKVAAGGGNTPQIVVSDGAVATTLSPTTTGTVAELLVAADLIARGWRVFFPLTRQATCDLIVLPRNGMKSLRIEVKPGFREGGSRLVYTPGQPYFLDHHAIVVRGEPVIYEPDLPVP